MTDEIATCPRCGTRHKADGSDTAGEWKPIRVAEALCNICAIGEHRARLYTEGKGTRWLIIGGKYMSPEAPVALGEADPRPNTPSNWKGCSGAKMHFQRDGCEPQTTYSMWHGGHVDKYMRDRMPDNGRWLTDADAAQAIEARRAETQGGSVHESAVAEGHAPTTPPKGTHHG